MTQTTPFNNSINHLQAQDELAKLGDRLNNLFDDRELKHAIYKAMMRMERLTGRLYAI